MIKIGDRLPSSHLTEFVPFEGEGCSVGPAVVKLPDALAGKTVAIVAVPGAFTPTCSEKHVPGFLDALPQLKAKGVDEVWCLSVNDPFVMGTWAREQKSVGKIRMLADGDAAFAKATGLTLDLTGRGMGLRSTRYSMLVRDGRVRTLNVEAPGKFEVSDAATLLAQARG